jgi:hypothetical protein
MKRLLFGMAPLLLLVGVVGCNSDSFGDLQNGVDHLDATPSQMFLQLGESKTVEVTGYDAQGNPQSLHYEATNLGPGITVVRDSTFRPIYTNDSTLVVPNESPTFRFIVTATAYALTSFDLTGGGKSVTVHVQSAATTVLDAAVSDTLPALGETVTITAPAGITFSATTTVTVANPLAVQPFSVAVAPDGKSLTFLPPPNMINQPLVISNVVSDAVPGTTFSPVTSVRFTTPELKALDAAISSLTPNGNQSVTVTLNNATWDPGATFAVGTTSAFVLDISGNVATILPVPTSVGLLSVTGVIPDTLPGYVLPLTNADTVTVGAAPQAPGTEDPSTAPTLTVPAPGSTVPFFDTPDFAGSVDHWYKLVVPADGDYTISLDWTVGSDIDMFLCPAPGTITGACNFDAATGNQPEENTVTLTANSTWYVIADDFGGDANGATITIAVSR